MSTWIQKQVEALRVLSGCVVVKWFCNEMAVREVGSDGQPQWYDETVPFLQLGRIDVVQLSDKPALLTTYQNHDTWGIYRSDGLASLMPNEPESGVIFRNREVNELPSGEIKSVDIQLTDCDIAALCLYIGRHEVTLRAGEVYEEHGGTLRIVEMDESILVQVDGRILSSVGLTTGCS